MLPHSVHDLASRFADGRLSTEKLIRANDEDLAQMLIEVRGIGRVCSFDAYAGIPYDFGINQIFHSGQVKVLHCP